MAPLPTEGPLDFSACEREPIHLIPHIQPHGVLLALDPQNFAVLQVSESIELHFGVPPERILREGLGALLDAADLIRLRERLAAKPAGDRHVHALLTIAQGGPYDVLCHHNDGVLLIEIEPFTPVGRRPPDFYPVLRRSLPQLRDEPSLASFCQRVVEEIRTLTRYDRVLLYRFLEDSSGEVLAEACAAEMPPYLGLRFPTNDVPRQVRALYTKSPVRVIVDARYTPSRLLPEHNPLTGLPVDLSYAHLRGVSAVHVEYLANMEVGGSMSLAIHRGEHLWGLIACHHRTPWALSHETRTNCAFIGDLVSAQVTEKEDREDRNERARVEAAHDALIARFTAAHDLLALASETPTPTSLLSCGGVAVLDGAACQRLGDTPGEPEVRALARFIAAQQADGIYASHTLANDWPPGAALQDIAAGVLAITLDDQGERTLLWFRPELVQTLSWAGDPNRHAERSSDGTRISPRRSFERWKETVRGRSAPFRPLDLDTARRLREALLR
ncbi:GAF domain-containing protein [Chondromyces crocatus]|uniref:Phytochrome chromophore attachment site domain-containing protein n=1 Tax=Chondromyces crocatus TaxID=52 RepID=A0A0K1END6_CHOCO|nr:GAF domain-containing protein [Chondromyces crocatus]AKT42445.1 uncharacterized protein CMC5_066710 [Chondromyces crocatus]